MIPHSLDTPGEHCRNTLTFPVRPPIADYGVHRQLSVATTNVP